MFKPRYIRVEISEVILCPTDNQWRSCYTGVMWFYFLVPKRSRTLPLETPVISLLTSYKRLLQLSSQQTRYLSSRLCQTWAWFLTISSRWQITSRLFVDPVSYSASADIFNHKITDNRRQENISEWIHCIAKNRLDYCNSLCHGISINEGLLNMLQHIQYVAARLVTDTWKYDHITPVLQDLHWLPIHQQIVFNLGTMSTNVSTGCVHLTLQDCIFLFSTRSRYHLRLAGKLEPLVPKTRTDIQSMCF